MNRNGILVITFMAIVVISLVCCISNKKNFKPKEVSQPNNASETGIDRRIRKYDISQIHPVLDGSGRVIGGTINGKWFNKEEIIKHIDEDMKFQFYSYNLDGFIGKYEGGNLKKIFQDEAYMRLSPTDENFYDITISIAGDWVIQPVLPKINRTNLPKDDQFIKDLLGKAGLDNSLVIIKEIITADLDGDGKEESIYNVSNITEKDVDNYCEMLEKNDADSILDLTSKKYSIVLVRKIKDGKEMNFTIEETYKELFVDDIWFVGDIDNDKKMEIYFNHELIEAIEYEGFSVGTSYIYKFNGEDLEKIEKIFHMPR